MVIKATCIIPFYNEGDRILGVLDSISKIDKIDQIICVDDGSTDDTHLLIKEKYPSVEIIRLNKNQGKSAAVKSGLSRAKNRFTFLTDADLEKINGEVIKKAFNKMEENPEIDMLIFKDKIYPKSFDFLNKLIRADIIFSGERILRKTDLIEVFSEFRPKSYELELSIDLYMKKLRKNTCWYYNFAQNPTKVVKQGIMSGWVDQIKMDYQVLIKQMGFVKLLLFSFNFCREKCP
jgi:glycosyltransferase involved in cell wall biosynthesis